MWLIWEDVPKEWLSQTLVNSAAKFAQGNREMWDKNLQEIVYAYNTAVQESTKHTPFEAMVGRVGRLLVHFSAISCYDADMKLQEFMEAETQGSFEHAAKRQTPEKAVKTNFEQAQKKQRNTMA